MKNKHAGGRQAASHSCATHRERPLHLQSARGLRHPESCIRRVLVFAPHHEARFVQRGEFHACGAQQRAVVAAAAPERRDKRTNERVGRALHRVGVGKAPFGRGVGVGVGVGVGSGGCLGSVRYDASLELQQRWAQR